VGVRSRSRSTTRSRGRSSRIGCFGMDSTTHGHGLAKSLAFVLSYTVVVMPWHNWGMHVTTIRHAFAMELAALRHGLAKDLAWYPL